jgi:hypothetical protein
MRNGRAARHLLGAGISDAGTSHGDGVHAQVAPVYRASAREIWSAGEPVVLRANRRRRTA